MDVKLPKLGEGNDSGTVASILVKVGDVVSEGQTLIEVENEKAVAPIPAPAAGKVTALRVAQGDRISVGQIILTLDGQGTAAVPAPARQPSPAPEQKPVPPPTPTPAADAFPGIQSPSPEFLAPPPPGDSSVGPAAAPSIRKLARDLGIDLTKVRGSERGGRIILADLRTYIVGLQQLAFQSKAAPKGQASAPVAESIDFSKWGPVNSQPLTSLRRTISRRMSESWSAVPRVTQFDEADITHLTELRAKYAPAYDKQGAKLTLTSFVLKATAATLKKHPIFNASLDEAAGAIVFKEYCHLGLAVDTDQGLIVPVIRDADKKSLLQLSKDIIEVAEKARQRKVSLEDLKGGTFTISNQGGIGGAHFTPIINRPEVAILGLGRGVQKPVVRDGQIAIRWMLPVTVAYDHRLIDGGTAARFCVDFVAALQTFKEEEVKL